jgi:hypothetical protein
VIDPLLAGLTSQAATQLKILKNNLQYLYEHAEQETENIDIHPTEKELLKSEIIYKKIKFCIKHHNAILE